MTFIFPLSYHFTRLVFITLTVFKVNLAAQRSHFEVAWQKVNKTDEKSERRGD